MWIQGYYPKYRIASLPPANIPWDKLTHVAFYSLAPTTEGAIENTSGDDIFALFDDLIPVAHANGVKVLIMVGGASAADDNTWRSATGANKVNFINNLVDLVVDNEFDGVEIDWEPMSSSSDEAQIVSFFQDLRAAMPADKQITAFISSSTTWKWGLGAAIQSYVDRVNISTYDLSYGVAFTVHDSPLYSFGSQPANKSIHAGLQNFLAAGLPLRKINISVPFFAMRWAGESALFDAATPNAFTTALYTALPGASATTEPTGAAYDDDSKAAYIASDPFTSFTSVQAMQDRVDYIKAQGVGGIVIWELAQAYFSGGSPAHPLMEPLEGEASAEDKRITGMASMTGVASITL